jgi:hypothetical protein
MAGEARECVELCATAAMVLANIAIANNFIRLFPD